MAAQRILVLYRGSLLTQGIERLLQERGRLEVIGVVLDSDEALESVCSFQPDVVIVDISDLDSRTNGLLLRDNPGAKIIYLRTADAQAQVVSTRQITVSNVRELLQVLEGG